jgi:hypothetical protein
MDSSPQRTILPPGSPIRKRALQDSTRTDPAADILRAQQDMVDEKHENCILRHFSEARPRYRKPKITPVNQQKT